MEYAYTTGELGTPTDTVNYTYDESWGDLLTAYDGVNISYDGIGNPLSDGTWSYTWEHGRELASMTDGTNTWSFQYDSNGMRTSRTNGTTTYTYVYNGGSLSKMTVGDDTLYFTYGADGHPLTVTHNNYTYFYVTNLQGDVIAILDSTGNPVVQYTYDAWGNILTVTDTSNISLATLNPLRYRGYVYDVETGLYYLQSRYYDPEVGRFINADAFASTGQGIIGSNMFAYCGNNPVTRTDIGGFFWDTVFDVVSLCFSIAEVIEDPDDPIAWLGVAADVASLVVPCVSGGGTLVRAAAKADDVVDAVRAVDNIDNAADSIKSANRIVHGNSLKTTKETVGYALRKIDTGEIMKFGETTQGVKRYTQKFYVENGVYMDIMAHGSKYDMHYWQHDQIIDYTQKNGVRPPWNKSDW